MTTKITAADVTPTVLVVPPPRSRPASTVRAVPAAGPVTTRQPERPAPPAAPGTAFCRCGHDARAHEHYRPGSDCGACGAITCARFRAEGRRWWPRLRRRA